MVIGRWEQSPEYRWEPKGIHSDAVSGPHGSYYYSPGPKTSGSLLYANRYEAQGNKSLGFHGYVQSGHFAPRLAARWAPGLVPEVEHTGGIRRRTYRNMDTKVAGRVGNKGWEHSTGYRWQLVGWEHPIRYSVVLGVQDLSHIPFYTPSWIQGKG